MNLTEAIEHASSMALPGFLSDDSSLNAERSTNEGALALLMDAWKTAPADSEPFSYDLIRDLADRNRVTCDTYGIERLNNIPGQSLSRRLSDKDLIRSVAALQQRDPTEVAKVAGPDLQDLGIAYLDAPIKGMVAGVDIETTAREPSRGYIVNVGLEFMKLTPKAKPEHPFTTYCGLPSLYEEKGVSLAEIHHISWNDIAGAIPFRKNKALQKALLATFERFPYMAHNAAFEDSWFMLHLDGYAEARKAGRIVPIDTRDICRRVDPEYRTLPHESRPAALENWARRRGVLAAGDSERHLGLEDVDLMFKTVQAEFTARNMF